MHGIKRPVRKVDIAQRTFNRFIRLRDSKGDNFKCISCGEVKPVSEITAGHFIGAGQTNILRFTEDNVFGQCFNCNCQLNGNIANFRIELTKRLGMKRVLELETLANMNFQFTREQLSAVILKYKLKINEF